MDLVRETLKFLSSRDEPVVDLDVEFAIGLVHALTRAQAVNESPVRVTFDIVENEGKKWYVASSSEPDEAPSQKFTYDTGLTGWAARNNRRSPLHLVDASVLPTGVHLNKPYKNTKSAFVYLIRAGRQPRACLCLVSDTSGAVSSELANEALQVGKLIEVLVARSSRSTSDDSFESVPSPPRGLDEENVLEWLYEWADDSPFDWLRYWKWDGQRELLVPIQVSEMLRPLGGEWLRPLRLDEGFVGSAASRNQVVRENMIRNGWGAQTQIKCSLGEIYPKVLLRSIIAVPVKDDFKLHGVLAALGETEDHFNLDDQAYLEKVAAAMTNALKAHDDRRVSRLQRRVRDSVDKGSDRPDKPSEFWTRLRRIFAVLERERVCTAAYFLIAKRGRSGLYTCKATTPSALSTLNATLTPADDPPLYRVLTEERGMVPIKSLRGSSVYKDLKRAGVSAVWADRYRMSSAKTREPTFFGFVTFRNRTSRSFPFGRRDLSGTFEHIFHSIFATARSVLSEANASRLAQEMERLMASETHELRQPLVSLRHEAEAMNELGERNEDRRRAIVSKAQELLLRVDNILYSTVYKENPDSKHEGEEETEVDMIEVVENAVRTLERAHSDVIFQIEAEGSQQLFVTGSRRWLEVVVRNVMSNAVKFGRAAPIRIRVECESSDDSGLRIVTAVKDHGIGIPKDQLKAIFTAGNQNPYSQRFTKLGSQVGLSIAKSIVEEHGGAIWATSELKQWSEVFIVLPGAEGGRHERTMG